MDRTWMLTSFHFPRSFNAEFRAATNRLLFTIDSSVDYFLHEKIIRLVHKMSENVD